MPGNVAFCLNRSGKLISTSDDGGGIVFTGVVVFVTDGVGILVGVDVGVSVGIDVGGIVNGGKGVDVGVSVGIGVGGVVSVGRGVGVGVILPPLAAITAFSAFTLPPLDTFEDKAGTLSTLWMISDFSCAGLKFGSAASISPAIPYTNAVAIDVPCV